MKLGARTSESLSTILGVLPTRVIPKRRAHAAHSCARPEPATTISEEIASRVFRRGPVEPVGFLETRADASERLLADSAFS